MHLFFGGNTKTTKKLFQAILYYYSADLKQVEEESESENDILGQARFSFQEFIIHFSFLVAKTYSWTFFLYHFLHFTLKSYIILVCVEKAEWASNNENTV